MLTVASLYHFAPLPDATLRRAPLEDLCRAEGLCGTLLLADEGVNGTVAGPAAGVAALLAHLRAWPGFAALAWREAQAEVAPFGRMRVRLRPEIVTMGVPGVAPAARVGRHVPAAGWNALVSAPDVAVIDTRNTYEVALGTFAGAEDPGTARFRDFPAWWAANRDRLAGKRLAMFCTGGIRCEKATSWLLGQGVEEVFHLRGGILSYLEEVAEEESLWRGECFVFDGRVSVGHGLRPGAATVCGACRRPLTAADRAHPAWEAGVCCPACEGEYGPADRARFRERERQMRLAAARGTRHLGAAPGD
jgi:UPF0176 protein